MLRIFGKILGSTSFELTNVRTQQVGEQNRTATNLNRNQQNNEQYVQSEDSTLKLNEGGHITRRTFLNLFFRSALFCYFPKE